jgi:predicted amidophosphoribosyltransferase
MDKNVRRIMREKKTVEAMIKIFCLDQHKTSDGQLCADCRELLDYANRRLKTCPFHADKTTCTNCKIHCYRPDMKVRIRDIMRYSGPRMICHHPILAIFHFIDGFRKQQGRQKS